MRILITAFLLVFCAFQANACGETTDCKLGDRHYRIWLPDNHTQSEPIGAIVFAHGFRGSARGVMRNNRLKELAGSLDLALIALKSAGPDWKIAHTPSAPENTDNSRELDYVDAVLADATKRFNLDPNRFLATGFSAGGMMVWTLACHRSTSFIGFAPISGTFWQPEPTKCETPPAHLVHIHGDNDPTVPLMGRPIRTTHQGRVPNVLEMYKSFGNYEDQTPYKTEMLTCDAAQNPKGRILQFCLFKGGHSFSVKYIAHAWDQILKAETSRR